VIGLAYANASGWIMGVAPAPAPPHPHTHTNALPPQDRVPAFSAAKAQAIIEADLGRPLGQLFASFDPQPIAAASLGQVCAWMWRM
jgi:hypothetical protein